MRLFTFIPVLLLVGLSSSVLAQTSIVGNWEVISTEFRSIADIPYGRVDYSGQIFQFAEDQTMVIENEWGYFITNYSVQDATIIYNNSRLQIDQSSERELKLIFQDSFTRRNLLLTLQRTRANPKLRKVVADLELEKDRYGDFRTDGVYYNYIEKDDSYAYVRFLPNGKRLSTKLSLPPEEALSRINMAYIFRDGGQVQLNAANYNDDLTSGLTSSEDREGTTEFSYEVLEDGDKMTEFYYFKSVGKGPSGARIEEASYEFYPTTELAYWTPKKEYEDCPHLNLPLVVPESTDEIFKVVESMPRFPCPRCDGGTGDESKRQLAYLSYIYKNLQYEQAEENQGIAVITFIIERNGRVAEPRIVRPINEHCGQAALAVAEKMIADGITWTPGKSEGVPMRVRYNMPVKFKLGK